MTQLEALVNKLVAARGGGDDDVTAANLLMELRKLKLLERIALALERRNALT